MIKTNGTVLFTAHYSLFIIHYSFDYRRSKTVRIKITLACQECKQRNYNTKKNKKNDPDRLEMKKHCKFCRKHTAHRETK